MRKQEITIANSPDSQFRVVLFPKNKVKARKNKNEQKVTDEVDIMQLQLTDMDGNKLPIQMTPDEALEISGLLVNAVAFYMQEFNREYRALFTDKVRKLDRNRRRREARR